MSATLKLKKLLSRPQNIAIFLHKNPDSDCRYSALALRDIFVDNGSKVVIYGEGPDRNFVAEIDKKAKYDHCFFVDTHCMKRVYEWEKALKIAKRAKTWIIDHHKTTVDGFEELEKPFAFVWNPDSTSCCEVIWELFQEFDGKYEMPKSAVLSLAKGLFLETSSLKNADATTLRHLSEMMDFSKSITIPTLEECIQNTFALEQLWGRAISSKEAKETFRGAFLFGVVKWADVKRYFPEYRGSDGCKKWQDEKPMTFLLERALKLTKNEYNSPIKRAAFLVPDKISPRTKVLLMFESKDPLDENVNKKLLDSGFFNYHSKNKRYLRFGLSEAGAHKMLCWVASLFYVKK